MYAIFMDRGPLWVQSNIYRVAAPVISRNLKLGGIEKC